MTGRGPDASTAPEPREADQSAALPDQLLKGRLYARLFPSAAPPLPRVGRFVLLRELGRGGMGVVLSAYDEQLDRKVAIKLLHGDAVTNEAARARLLREARALARLSHPNVVQVHEAGVHDQQVYLAMEHVEGVDLRQWLKEHAPQSPRGRWRAVLERMLAAGEGLAAAHGAGLMHRDFKPDNVLVGADGRVRVADFGLAVERRGEVGETGEAEVEEPTMVSGSGSSEVSGPRTLQRLTRTGATVGTVAYMPFEQLSGGEVDARSDQFSFCVTLYEALFGERPFGGRTRGAVAAALDEGVVSFPESGAAVPRWLRGVLTRGLSKEPGARFPDMAALLRALKAPLRQRRVGMASAAVLVAAGIAVGVGGARGMTEPCAEAGRGIEEVWNEEARARLGAVLPEDSGGLVIEALDQWVGGWRSTAALACEQVHVEQRASAESLDVRGRCLDSHRNELDFVLDALEVEQPTGSVVVEAMAILDDPADCLLDRGDPLGGLDEHRLAEHRRLSARVVELDLRQRDRTVEERRTQLEAIYEDAERQELDALRAELAYVQGRLAVLMADRDAARRWLGEAIDLGERLGLSDLRARAWLLLSESTAEFDLDASRALWIWSRVGALLEDLPRPHVLRARSRLVRSRIDLLSGELGAADSGAREAIDQFAAIGPTANLHRAEALRLRGLIASRRGNADLERKLLAQSREARVLHADARGLDSSLGGNLVDDGLAHLDNGELLRAREVLERARSQTQRELPQSRALAEIHVGLSAVADAMGDPLEAQRQAELADALIRQQGGPLDLGRIGALSARGAAAYRQERFEDAAHSFELALRIAERAPNPVPWELAFSAVNLAEARHALGEHRVAARLLDDAIDELHAKLGPDHADLSFVYKARGSVRLALGRPEEAETDLRRSLAIHERSGDSPVEAAETIWLLARALDELGRSSEAFDSARAAVAKFSALGPQWEGRVVEIEAWLGERSRNSRPRLAPDSNH